MATGLQVHCCRCGEQLTEPGALVFSPPIDDHVVKFHVCMACWTKRYMAEHPVPQAEGRL